MTINALIKLPKERSLFPINKIYPLTKKYLDCLLPINHSWEENAKEAIGKVTECIHKQELLSDTFEEFAGTPEFVLTRKEDPFVIKIRVDKDKDLNKCIKRPLLSNRLKQFCEEEQLDRIYIPKKFLKERHEQNLEMSYENYAVLAEKLSIAENLPYDCALEMKELREKNQTVPFHLLEMENNAPQKIWNRLDEVTKMRQKRQAAFVIAKLAYTDGHRGNIVLLQNGCFTILDSDEPDARIIFSKLRALQDNQQEDNLGLLRDQEIEFAKIGLKNFLEDENTNCRYSKETNGNLYQEYMLMLKKELKENELHRKCHSILSKRNSHT